MTAEAAPAAAAAAAGPGVDCACPPWECGAQSRRHRRWASSTGELPAASPAAAPVPQRSPRSAVEASLSAPPPAVARRSSTAWPPNAASSGRSSAQGAQGRLQPPWRAPFFSLQPPKPRPALVWCQVWSLGQPTPNFTLEGHDKGVNCVDYFTGRGFGWLGIRVLGFSVGGRCEGRRRRGHLNNNTAGGGACRNPDLSSVPLLASSCVKAPMMLNKASPRIAAKHHPSIHACMQVRIHDHAPGFMHAWPCIHPHHAPTIACVP